jgi:mono/diheme cytochrome c family protein
LLLVCLTGAACRAPLPPPEAFSPAALAADGERYLGDPAFRRRTLVESLENPSNGYSAQRLASYGLSDHGWDLLPEWTPRSQPVHAGERADAPLAADAAPLWDGRRPETVDGWVALGREVFFGYPLRAEPALGTALSDPARAQALGLEETAGGVYPGMRRFADVDGTVRIGITCALCHATVRSGALVVGAARRRFDFGRLLLWQSEVSASPMDPEMAARLQRWGPGRADITEDRDEDPVAIPDLWGLRGQSALTQGATLKHLGPVTLALRQETQLIEANHQRTRPPRELSWALALYVYSLAPPSDRPVFDARELDRGRAIFQDGCQRCHDNASGGGAPVAAWLVGTDPALARGSARGTGLYRPPALIDLGEAGPYLHHGALASLDDLLRPDRLRADWRSGVLGPGPVPGHEYGLDLPNADRTALEHYLYSR